MVIFRQDFGLDGFLAGLYFRRQLKHRIEQSRSSATAFLLIDENGGAGNELNRLTLWI